MTKLDASTWPLACTLSGVGQKTRLEEWRTLRREALLSENEDGLVWTSLWRSDVRARLEALVAAERECCSFLTFELDAVAEGIRMRTHFPPSAEGMLRAFVR